MSDSAYGHAVFTPANGADIYTMEGLASYARSLEAEVEKLRAALEEIETLRPFLEKGREAEGWKHLAGRRREIARDALHEEIKMGGVQTP